MSKILRRPMFRGGRVDSRGTGITTGLDRPGLSGGGMPPVTGGDLMSRIRSANTLFFDSPRNVSGFDRTQPKTFLGMNIPGTGMAMGTDGKPITLPQRNFAEDLMFVTGPGKFLKAGGGGLNIIRQAGKFPLSGSGKEIVEQVPFLSNQYLKQVARPYLSGMKETLKPMGQKIKDFGILGALGLGGAGVAISGLDDYLSEQYEGPKTPSGSEEPQDDNSEELAKILNKLNENKKKELESKLPTEEDLEINKEKYSKLLGGDKAKAEDISNMLLSFAGKALAPEATVKSAFAEFAEEEAKRPSKKSKVDESAAALAINEYIAGKKSKAELDRFFAEMDYKKSLASRAGPEYVASNIAEASKSASGYKAIELGLQISFPEGGRPVKIEKGQANEVPLTLDNLNKVFIEDEAPYTAVQIVAVDGKLVRNPVY